MVFGYVKADIFDPPAPYAKGRGDRSGMRRQDTKDLVALALADTTEDPCRESLAALIRFYA